MNKKVLSWIFMILGVAVLGTGLVLRFGFNNSAISLDAAALSLIGLSLSLDYRGGKFLIPLRVCQALAGLMIAASAVSWFVPFPQPASIALRLGAVAVNLPLAALGLGKNEK